MPLGRLLDSLKRHINNYELGIDDPEHGDNLGAAAWNLDALMDTEERCLAGELPEELLDLPRYAKREKPPFPPAVATSAQAEPLHIYVAGPFSAPTARRRERNVLRAAWAGLICAKAGHLVHVPHVATHLWHGYLEYEQFMALDFSVLREWATCLLLLDHSPGADRELELATSLKLPIFRSWLEVPGVPEWTEPTWSAFYWQHTRFLHDAKTD